VECTDRDDFEDDELTQTMILPCSESRMMTRFQRSNIPAECWAKSEVNLSIDLGLHPGDLIATQTLHLSTRRAVTRVRHKQHVTEPATS